MRARIVGGWNLRHLPVCQSLGLLRIGLGAGLPDHLLDLVFTVGAQVFSEAAPVETCETAPEVTSLPISGRLNFLSAYDAGVHFSSAFIPGSPYRRLFIER